MGRSLAVPLRDISIEWLVCLCVRSVQWTNDSIADLLYNSEYFFDVEYETADRLKQSSQVTLTTPGCPMLLDESFKRCSHLGPPLTGAAAALLT